MLRDLEICILECDGEAIEGFKDAADFNLKDGVNVTEDERVE